MVDGIAREYEERATVLRADIQSEAGAELARRLDVSVVPTFVFFGRDGSEVTRFGTTLKASEAQLRRGLRQAGAP
ncbi:MAG TPA: thioredoxin family protein [Actinomycetota bacterium]|nr:thioredoxin family protein [Actinomycetota bacterium]